MQKFISRNFKYFFELGETIRFCGEACHIDGALPPAAFPLQVILPIHERSDPPRHASKHPRGLPPRRTPCPPRLGFQKMERQGILALAWGVETRGLAALKKTNSIRAGVGILPQWTPKESQAKNLFFDYDPKSLVSG